MNSSAAVWQSSGKRNPRLGFSRDWAGLSTSHILGVITGNSSDNVKAFLAAHGLSDCIRAIYGVDAPGSKAEKITLAQNQFAAGSEAVCMVGDSASDVHAAKEAGVKCIAVGWGHQSAETLLRAKPDALIHSPKELREAVANLSNLEKS
jgi:phosphoglycolate phosphatase